MANKTWIGGTGSQSWATSGNWSPSGAPATGDDVYLLSGTSAIDSGLSQSAVQLASLVIGPSFKGSVGTNTAPLAIGADAHDIDGTSQAARFNFDFGSSATGGVIVNAQSGTTDNGLEWVRMIGADITTTVYGGTVGIGTSVGDTATLTKLDISPSTNNAGNIATVVIGPGVTITAIYQNVNSSTITANSACPTLINLSGTFIHQGSGALGASALTVGGTVYPNSSGAVSTNPAIVLGGGKLDFSTSPISRTVSHPINLYAGATLNADIRYVTLSGGFKTVECLLSSVQVNVGVNHTFAVS